VDALAFDGERPDAAALSGRWREILRVAREVIALLPADQAGTCVMSGEGLFRGDVEELRTTLAEGTIWFRQGSIRGVFPRIVS